MDLINKFKLKPANKTNPKIVSFNPTVSENTFKANKRPQRETIITEKNQEEICDLSGIVMASETNSSNTGGCARALLINMPLKPEENSIRGDFSPIDQLQFRNSIH
jgi:hypothetical protein